MTENDHRQIARDSLFVMADLRIDGTEGEHRIRVRNLSAGGLMAEGGPSTQRGQVAWVNVRNIGWVEGSVAWVQDSRFGIAFREDIDPQISHQKQAVACDLPVVAIGHDGSKSPGLGGPAYGFAQG